MLTTLPTELLLQILSYLPLSTLSSIARLNKTYARLVDTNESVIYRNAACLLGLAREEVQLDEVLGECEMRERVRRGVEGWKEYCKRRTNIHHAWHARAPSNIKFYTSFKSSNSVHRIKVDEKRGFVITTSQRGGLSVVDLESDRVLWGLPRNYVRPFAHLEYESGYLIFDRTNGSKEIWRLSSLPPPSLPLSPTSLPDPLQLAQHTPAPNGNAKGHFSPHAHITPPTQTRAYRFVYPDLLAASAEVLYIYNIPTGTLTSTITGIQSPLLGDLNYVDLSAKHVFVAAQRGISVFSRERESMGCVLHLGSALWEYGRRVGVDLREGEERGFWSEIRRGRGGRSGSSFADVARGGEEDWVPDEEGEREEEDEEDEWEGYDVGFDMYVRPPKSKANRQVVAGSSSSAPKEEEKRTWESRWGGSRVRDSMSVEHRVTFDVVPEGDEDSRERRVVDEFIAVHVSRDGKHFAALLSNSRLLLVQNFKLALSRPSPSSASAPSSTSSTSPTPQPESSPLTTESVSTKTEFEQPATRSPVPLEDLTLDIQLGSRRSPSVYLAFEDDRVAVVSQSAIWIAHVPPPPSTSAYANPLSYPNPPIRITRIPALNTPWHLARISCLQLSPSGLFINWHNDPPFILTDSQWQSATSPSSAEIECHTRAEIALGGSGAGGGMRLLGFGDEEERRERDRERDRGRDKWVMRQNEERFEREFWGRVGESGCFASTPSGDLIVLDDGIQVGMDFRQNTVVAVEFVLDDG